MPFKDSQAKTDYQREYMRKRRGSNTEGLTGSNNQGSNEQGLTGGITPSGSLEQPCRYCGLPTDQPSPQCNRHNTGVPLPMNTENKM